MKSDAQPVNPSPVYTVSEAARRLQSVLDDLRLIHRAEVCQVAGHGPVDVCATCRPPVEAAARYTDATSGRELYPCPTLRIARRHARMAGAR